MKWNGIGLGVFLLMAGGLCAAQTPDAGNGTAGNPKPAASSTDSSNNAGEKKKPKKVWTNDEIGSAKGTISVVGDANSSGEQGKRISAAAGNSSGDGARNQQTENYRNEIQRLRSQIDAIDKRIAQLKSFKAENTSPSGGININQGYNMVPIEDQVKELEGKKKQLEAKIDDVEVEAEKKGIDPGDLR